MHNQPTDKMVLVVLRYRNGREEAIPFVNRYWAELFVSWIPAMQLVSTEYEQVCSAIIRTTTEMTKPIVTVDLSN